MRDYSGELQALMDMTMELLAVLDSSSEWSAEDDDKLKRVEKIANLVVKVKNAIGEQAAPPVSLEEDEQIIARFLARVKSDD